MDEDIVDTMETWLQARLEALHTSMPAVVQTYNPTTRLATVVPSVRQRSLHGDLLEIKPITDVPVVWAGCQRFSVLPKTLVAGDGVLLHFSETALGNWLRGKGTMDAEDETRFSLHDCIAVPGLYQVLSTPQTQMLGTADFGLAGSLGEVLGGSGGKVDIHNQVSTLRTQLEGILDAMKAMNTALVATMASFSTPPSVPYVNQSATITAAKTALKGLLQ